MYLLIYTSLHVSSMSCSSSGETNCINTASGNCHSVLVSVPCAGWEQTLLLEVKNLNINLEKFHFVGLYCIIILRCTVQQSNNALINVPCVAKVYYHTPLQRVNGASVSLFQKFQSCFRLFVSFGGTAPSGPGPRHSRGFEITHKDGQQSVGLLWTSDQLVAETST